MEDYAKTYIDTFHTGIKKTKYKISGENSNSSSFFHELNEKTKKVKENGGRLFFFGNGASASFSNHFKAGSISSSYALNTFVEDEFVSV